MIDLKSLTIKKAHDHLKRGDFSVAGLAENYLKEIEKKDKEIHAYLEVFDDVEDQAHEAQKLFDAGRATTLTGIPFAIKDNILIKGRRVGAASKILEGYHATYDATVIKKLKAEGAIFLGRANMDEFAMGSSTENSAYGPTKNPHDLSRVPGGSSGGSAAAVAANMTLAALGSDTGGSVRQPAAFCGIVGLKPTYGAVSRFGLMAMGSSLDQIGPLAKTTEDAEIIFNAIKGKDPDDSTSRDFAGPKQNRSKIRIGLLSDFVEEGGAGMDRAASKNYVESIERLKTAGLEAKKIKADTAPLKHALAAYYIIMPAEVSSNLARYDGVKFGAKEEGENLLGDYLKTRGRFFGREARRRIILGTYVLSAGYYDAYYNKAVAARGLIQNAFRKIFEEVDVVLTPTTPTLAFKIGEKTSDPLQMYLADIFTISANIAGSPAISVPSGFVEVNGKKLPIGVQFMAPEGREDILFGIGRCFETGRA